MKLRHFFSRIFLSILIALLWALATPAVEAQHVLKVTPSTMQWGFFAAEAKPVLTVKSGDTVTIAISGIGALTNPVV